MLPYLIAVMTAAKKRGERGPSPPLDPDNKFIKALLLIVIVLFILLLLFSESKVIKTDDPKAPTTQEEVKNG